MSSRVPLIYSSPLLYRIVMRLLYGRYFDARYRVIDEIIPAGTSVLDVCAGDCWLYRKYLRGRIADYRALDASQAFVDAAERRGIRAALFDARTGELPRTDCVLMQASLYQFLPDADSIVERLKSAARTMLIIAEPVRNLSDTSIPVLSWASKKLTKPDASADRYAGLRFNESSFRALCNRIGGIERLFLIPGGREMVCVFRGGADQ